MSHTFTISATDVERWAEFSGDRNPVHFDHAAAHAFGVPFPFAHGMLSIIPIKALINLSIGEAPFSVDFRFARPLKVGAVVRVSLGTEEPVAIKVIDAIGGAPLIYGTAIRGTDPKHLEAVETTTLSGDKFDTPLVLHECCSGLPAWVQLEAKIFSDFIHSGMLEQAIADHMSKVEDPKPRGAYTLLHTRNVTFVNTPAAPLEYLAGTLCFAATTPSLTAVKGGYIISFSLGIEAMGKSILLSKATLMLRLNSKS